MCEKSAMGVQGTPYNGGLNTGLEECQRSGVFINGSRAPLAIATAGIISIVPPGKVATIPVSSDIRLRSDADSGVISWTVTSAVLPAQLADAPTGELHTDNRTFTVPNTGTVIRLASGDYSKLVFFAPLTAAEVTQNQ